MNLSTPAPVLLYTMSEEVADAVCATAAALGLSCDVVEGLDALLGRWTGARAVLVGGDVAARVASAAPRRRSGVYLVGHDSVELTRWSMPLGAEVVPLPHGLACPVATSRSAISPATTRCRGCVGWPRWSRRSTRRP